MPLALANVIAPAAVSLSSSPGSAGRRRSARPPAGRPGTGAGAGRIDRAHEPCFSLHVGTRAQGRHAGPSRYRRAPFILLILFLLLSVTVTALRITWGITRSPLIGDWLTAAAGIVWLAGLAALARRAALWFHRDAVRGRARRFAAVAFRLGRNDDPSRLFAATHPPASALTSPVALGGHHDAGKREQPGSDQDADDDHAPRAGGRSTNPPAAP